MSDYRTLAREAYDRCLAANDGRLGGLDEVVEEMLTQTDPANVAQYHRDYVVRVVREEDRKRLKRGESLQGSLLSGELDALDGVWAIGEGGRVVIRYSRLVEHSARIAAQMAHAAASNQKLAISQQEFSELLPHYKTAQTTTPEAIASWQAANPNRP